MLGFPADSKNVRAGLSLCSFAYINDDDASVQTCASIYTPTYNGHLGNLAGGGQKTQKWSNLQSKFCFNMYPNVLLTARSSVSGPYRSNNTSLT